MQFCQLPNNPPYLYTCTCTHAMVTTARQSGIVSKLKLSTSRITRVILKLQEDLWLTKPKQCMEAVEKQFLLLQTNWTKMN